MLSRVLIHFLHIQGFIIPCFFGFYPSFSVGRNSTTEFYDSVGISLLIHLLSQLREKHETFMMYVVLLDNIMFLFASRSH